MNRNPRRQLRFNSDGRHVPLADILCDGCDAVGCTVVSMGVTEAGAVEWCWCTVQCAIAGGAFSWLTRHAQRRVKA